MQDEPTAALPVSSDWKRTKKAGAGGRGYRFSAATPFWRRQTGGLYLRKIFQKLLDGVTQSCRARANGLAYPGWAQKPQGELRFRLHNIDPARRRSRKTGTSDGADATAPAGAVNTWTRPILPAQSARRILCTCSKDTCTSQTSQNKRIFSDDWRPRSRRRERNQPVAGLSESNHCAGPTLRFRKIYSIQWKP